MSKKSSGNLLTMSYPLAFRNTSGNLSVQGKAYWGNGAPLRGVTLLLLGGLDAVKFGSSVNIPGTTPPM